VITTPAKLMITHQAALNYDLEPCMKTSSAAPYQNLKAPPPTRPSPVSESSGTVISKLINLMAIGSLQHEIVILPLLVREVRESKQSLRWTT
jgi:hypothetical protein